MPPSPTVRNHRNAVRLALESMSALHRIPQDVQVELLAEIEAMRLELDKLRKVTRPIPWYADDAALNYRNPWPPTARR